MQEHQDAQTDTEGDTLQPPVVPSPKGNTVQVQTSQQSGISLDPPVVVDAHFSCLVARSELNSPDVVEPVSTLPQANMR